MSISSKSSTFSLDVEITYLGLFRSQEVGVDHKNVMVMNCASTGRFYQCELEPFGLKMHIGVLNYQEVSPDDICSLFCKNRHVEE